MTLGSEKTWHILLTIAFGYLFEVRLCYSTNTSCPSSCFCDDVFVSCEGDGQWSIPVDIPRSTIRLDIRNFAAISLTEITLLPLTDIREIKIQECQLASIEGGVFAHMTKLMNLDLSQNRLANLSSDVFEGLRNLRYLDLSSNCITNISNAFLELTSIEQLVLRSNRIRSLDNRSFRGLINLQYLNMDFNEITTIEADAFLYITKLVHLTLSNNPIKSLHRLDFFSERLQYIDVSNSGLERIPQSLTRFVRDLRVGKNNITRISAGDFDSYPYLGFLVLDDNKISEIEADALGRQDYLLRLWLNGNELKNVPADLPPSLRTLHVEQNKLEELLPYSFRGLMALEHLFLPRNLILNLSVCAFCDLVSLKSLDLQGNRIENLYKGIFANLTNLETLDLSQNKVKRLDPSCFYGLLSLRTLHLSRIYTSVAIDKDVFKNMTSLRTVEMYDSAHLAFKVFSSTRMLQSLQNLQEINIMHNKLVRLRPDLMSFFPHIKLIKLSDNDWDCSSNILWLSNWLRSSPTQFFRSHTIRCATPHRLHSIPIKSLSEMDFAEDNGTISDLISDNITTVLPINTVTINLTLETFRRDNDSEISPVTEITSFPVDVRQNGPYSYKTILTTTPLTTSTKTDITPKEVNITIFPLSLKASKHENKTGESSVASRSSHFQMLVADIPEPTPPPTWDSLTTITIVTTLAGGCLILFASVIILLAICRFRFPMGKRRQFSSRRSNSISYYPQQDEVAILTVSENTVG